MGRVSTFHIGDGEDAAFTILSDLWGASTQSEVFRRALQLAVERETGKSWGEAYRNFVRLKAQREAKAKAAEAAQTAADTVA